MISIVVQVPGSPSAVTRSILLGNNRGIAIVDEADYAEVSQFNWRILKAPHTSYAHRHVGDKNQYLHTFLTGWTETDHANRDGLDNRRCNLREVTAHTQNMANRKSTGGASQFKGVTFDKRWGKWHAKIKYNGKRTYLGGFANEEDAARAYDEAAIAQWGEFASVNFS